MTISGMRLRLVESAFFYLLAELFQSTTEKRNVRPISRHELFTFDSFEYFVNEYNAILPRLKLKSKSNVNKLAVGDEHQKQEFIKETSDKEWQIEYLDFLSRNGIINSLIISDQIFYKVSDEDRNLTFIAKLIRNSMNGGSVLKELIEKISVNTPFGIPLELLGITATNDISYVDPKEQKKLYSCINDLIHEFSPKDEIKIPTNKLPNGIQKELDTKKIFTDYMDANDIKSISLEEVVTSYINTNNIKTISLKEIAAEVFKTKIEDVNTNFQKSITRTLRHLGFEKHINNSGKKTWVRHDSATLPPSVIIDTPIDEIEPEIVEIQQDQELQIKSDPDEMTLEEPHHETHTEKSFTTEDICERMGVIFNDTDNHIDIIFADQLYAKVFGIPAHRISLGDTHRISLIAKNYFGFHFHRRYGYRIFYRGDTIPNGVIKKFYNKNRALFSDRKIALKQALYSLIDGKSVNRRELFNDNHDEMWQRLVISILRRNNIIIKVGHRHDASYVVNETQFNKFMDSKHLDEHIESLARYEDPFKSTVGSITEVDASLASSEVTEKSVEPNQDDHIQESTPKPENIVADQVQNSTSDDDDGIVSRFKLVMEVLKNHTEVIVNLRNKMKSMQEHINILEAHRTQ